MKNTKIKFVVLGMSVLLTILIAAGTLYAYDSVVTGKNNAENDVQGCPRGCGQRWNVFF